jgi:hypothetical protein
MTKTRNFTGTVQLGVWDLASLLLQTRLAEAMENGKSRYPIYRTLRIAAHMDLDLLFDRLAMELGWRAQRADDYNLLLDNDDHLVSCHGSRKSTYCSCSFTIYAKDVAAAEGAIEAIKAVAGPSRIEEAMFSIDWFFLTGKGELRSTSIEELANDTLLDSAYPVLKKGVDKFIAEYLDADESVLVLQGEPGTGKTRLIRAILAAMSKRKKGQAQALYTGDKKALESDEIFIEFITGRHDAFIVEDADHHLRPRSDGNENLHRFLTIADGIVRSQGRKIIFSTNLPNPGDIDPALVRPGRCFALLETRELTPAEAKDLTVELCAAKDKDPEPLIDRLAKRGHVSVADVYQLVNAAK